jgi:cell division protein FtsX
LSFSIFFLRSIFNRFWNDIQVKKLLWATKSQIIMPFLTLILYSIIGGFLISLLLTLISMGIFDYYMSQLFSYTLTAHLFEKWWIIIVLFIVEILVIVWALMGISYGFVSKLHKKLK